jgi:hypothetical protein
MHSLESECLELRAVGLIDEPAGVHAAALERGAVFSVFEELRFVLYAAVAAVVGGLGLVIKENLDRIGPLTLMAVLALAAAGCYATALRTRMMGRARTIGGDYLLLLGALIVSADLGYAESQFHWLGSEWQWYLIILAVFHGACAYALDSRLVLSLSLASVMAWFGIEGRMTTLFETSGSAGNVGTHGLICAGTILAWRAAQGRFGGSAQFADLLENFAANIGFWGAMSWCLTPGLRLYGFATLCVLAAACTLKALRSGEVIFLVYGITYTALTLCCMEAQIIKDSLFAAMLALATVVAGALLLWNLNQRVRAVRA